jgi:hypothetical protein
MLDKLCDVVQRKAWLDYLLRNLGHALTTFNKICPMVTTSL